MKWDTGETLKAIRCIIVGAGLVPARHRGMVKAAIQCLL